MVSTARVRVCSEYDRPAPKPSTPPPLPVDACQDVSSRSPAIATKSRRFSASVTPPRIPVIVAESQIAFAASLPQDRAICARDWITAIVTIPKPPYADT